MKYNAKIMKSCFCEKLSWMLENSPIMNTKSKPTELHSGKNSYKRWGMRQKLWKDPDFFHSIFKFWYHSKKTNKQTGNQRCIVGVFYAWNKEYSDL